MASRFRFALLGVVLVGCGEALELMEPVAPLPPAPPTTEIEAGVHPDAAGLDAADDADVFGGDAARDGEPEAGKDRGDGGALVWDRRLGEPSGKLLHLVARVAPEGDVIASGPLEGTILLGSTTLTSNGPSYRNVFLTRLDPNGAYRWARRFEGPASLAASAFSVDSNGIWMSGYFAQSVDMGGGQLVSTDAMSDGLIARLDPTGAHLWSKRFGEAGGQSVEARARIGSDIVVTGVNVSGGTIDFGGGPLGGNNVLARLDGATGAHVWSKQLVAGKLVWRGVTTDANGNVIIAADLNGSIDWGSEVVTSAGESDVYIAKLDPMGNLLWQKRFGTAERQGPLGIAVAADGSIYIAGATSGPIDFGGGPVAPAHPVTGLVTTFLAKLASTGATLWTKVFSTTGPAMESVPAGLAVDPADNVMLVGTAACGLDFGGGKLPAIEHGTRIDNVYVAKLDSSGAHLWSRGWAHIGPLEPSTMFDARGISIDASGNAIITLGARAAVVDLGSGPRTVGLDNMFVMKLAP